MARTRPTNPGSVMLRRVPQPFWHTQPYRTVQALLSWEKNVRMSRSCYTASSAANSIDHQNYSLTSHSRKPPEKKTHTHKHKHNLECPPEVLSAFRRLLDVLHAPQKQGNTKQTPRFARHLPRAGTRYEPSFQFFSRKYMHQMARRGLYTL